MWVLRTKKRVFSNFACAFVQNRGLISLKFACFALITHSDVGRVPPMLGRPLVLLAYAGKIFTNKIAKITFDQGRTPHYRAN